MKNITDKIDFINNKVQYAINNYMPYDNDGDDVEKIKSLIKKHLLNIITLRAKDNKKTYQDFLSFKSVMGYRYIDFNIFTMGKNDVLIYFSIDCEPKEINLVIDLDELINGKSVNDFSSFEISLDKKRK